MSEVDDTRSDELLGVSFRLAGIPVRIEATFVIAALIVGRGQEGWWRLGWFAVVFISILVHELGHAVTLRAFGDTPRIRLWAFGGLTYPTKALSPVRDVLVALAGSLTQVVLLGVPATIARDLVVPQDLTQVRWWLLLSDVAWVSLGWGFLNLLPILPLDGGLVARRMLGHRLGGRGELAAVVLSIVTALAGGAWAYRAGRTGLALYAVFFAGWNIVTLVRARDDGSRERLAEGRRLWRDDRREEAEAAFLDAMRTARSHAARTETGEALAWAMIHDGRITDARKVADELRQDPSDASALRPVLDLLEGRAIEEATAAIAAWWLRHPEYLLGPPVIPELERRGVLMRFLELLLVDPGPHAIELVAAMQASLHQEGRYASAIDVGVRVLDDPRSSSALIAYNIACSTARTGHLGLALDWLDRAVEAGWRDQSQMTIDDDLAPLQRLPRFEAILERAARPKP